MNIICKAIFQIVFSRFTKIRPIMFLVNWFQANLLMIFTTLALIGIPAVIVYIVWGKKSDSSSE